MDVLGQIALPNCTVMQAGKSKDSLPSGSSTPDSVDTNDSFYDSMSIPVDTETETSSPTSRGKGNHAEKQILTLKQKMNFYKHMSKFSNSLYQNPKQNGNAPFPYT